MAIKQSWLLDLARKSMQDDEAEAACQRELSRQADRGGRSSALEYQEIDLSENRLTWRSSQNIVELGFACHDLRVVKLSRNELCDRALPALCSLLAHCKMLEQLHLSHNRLTDDAVRKLVSSAQDLRIAAGVFTGRVALWARLDLNFVQQPGALLEELRLRVGKPRIAGRCAEDAFCGACDAADAQGCGPRTCRSGAIVHLPYFTRQRSGDRSANVVLAPVDGGVVVRTAASTTQAMTCFETPPGPKTIAHMPVPTMAGNPCGERKKQSLVPPPMPGEVAPLERSQAAVAVPEGATMSVAQGTGPLQGMPSATPHPRLPLASPPAEVAGDPAPPPPPPEEPPPPETPSAEAPRSESQSNRVAPDDQKRAGDRKLRDREGDREQHRDRGRDRREREKEHERRRHRDEEDRRQAEQRSRQRKRRRDGSSDSAGTKRRRESRESGRAEQHRRGDERATIGDRNKRKEKEPAHTRPSRSKHKDGKEAIEAKEPSDGKKTRSSKWGPHSEPVPGQQFPPGSPEAVALAEAARLEIARLNAAGQAAPAWLAVQALGGSAPSPGSAPPPSTPAKPVADDRKAAIAKARKAAPPPPWMAAAAVFQKRPDGPSASPAVERTGGAGTGFAAAPSPSAASAAASSASAAAEALRRKLDLTDISGLQRSITDERNKLRLFVIKAKQEYEERKERARAGGAEPVGETDKEEYYSASTGEEFGPNRMYRIEGPIGRGVFSSVYRCKSKDGKEYAVKFVRSNVMMRRAAEKEVEMYRRLAKEGPREDPEGARYLINLAGAETFEHAGHLCFCMDLLKCDMRFALQKYGQGGGLPLPTLVQYTRQIFLGLRTLRKLKVIHADLKPDNILMTMSKAEVQICDFGSAMEVSEQLRTSYAQPRYYRAPEIILGLPYDTQIDVWSFGVTLFELATGRILFTGKTNNQMVKQFIDVCGIFPRKLMTEGEFSRKHFSSTSDFLHRDPDSITGEPDVVPVAAQRQTRTVLALLKTGMPNPHAGMEQAVHDKWVKQFADLVSTCLRPDHELRIEPANALQMPFFDKDR